MLVACAGASSLQETPKDRLKRRVPRNLQTHEWLDSALEGHKTEKAPRLLVMGCKIAGGVKVVKIQHLLSERRQIADRRAHCSQSNEVALTQGPEHLQDSLPPW